MHHEIGLKCGVRATSTCRVSVPMKSEAVQVRWGQGHTEGWVRLYFLVCLRVSRHASQIS